MRKAGRKEETITDNIDRLSQIAKNCNDLNDPEQVKAALARMNTWANVTKANAISTYTVYLRTIGKTWHPPKYIIQEKLYFIPTEQEIDALIAASGVLTPLLQLLKETGMRRGEAWSMEWKDIDLEHKTVTVNHPEKGSLPRILNISDKLKGMINGIPQTLPRPFARDVKNKKSLNITFEQTRARAAKQLSNPRLLQIHFHTFRHWKATTDYYRDRDERMIRHVLGHRTSIMTDRYIHIVETLYQDDSGQWTARVAENNQEELDLIATGFQFVRTRADGKPVYRKRK